MRLSLIGWLLWIIVIATGLVFGVIWVLVEILDWLTGNKD